MAILKYGNDYVVKTGSGSRNNSGPSGKRKMRGYRIIRANLAEAAEKYGIVLWCSDQHRNFGTGSRAKFDADMRGKMTAALTEVRRAAVQGMKLEHAA